MGSACAVFSKKGANKGVVKVLFSWVTKGKVIRENFFRRRQGDG